MSGTIDESAVNQEARCVADVLRFVSSGSLSLQLTQASQLAIQTQSAGKHSINTTSRHQGRVHAASSRRLQLHLSPAFLEAMGCFLCAAYGELANLTTMKAWLRSAYKREHHLHTLHS